VTINVLSDFFRRLQSENIVVILSHRKVKEKTEAEERTRTFLFA